jgi:hypothetical protein
MHQMPLAVRAHVLVVLAMVFSSSAVLAKSKILPIDLEDAHANL